MSKPGCTGAARALAKRFKNGGDLHKAKSKKKGPKKATKGSYGSKTMFGHH